MKKRLTLALIRTPLWLTMRTCEGVHWLCSRIWERLEAQEFDPLTATVDDYQRHYRVNRRKAYELYQQYRGTPRDTFEVYTGGKPLSPAALRAASPFVSHNIGNMASEAM